MNTTINILMCMCLITIIITEIRNCINIEKQAQRQKEIQDKLNNGEGLECIIVKKENK